MQFKKAVWRCCSISNSCSKYRLKPPHNGDKHVPVTKDRSPAAHWLKYWAELGERVANWWRCCNVLVNSIFLENYTLEQAQWRNKGGRLSIPHFTPTHPAFLLSAALPFFFVQGCHRKCPLTQGFQTKTKFTPVEKKKVRVKTLQEFICCSI